MFKEEFGKCTGCGGPSYSDGRIAHTSEDCKWWFIGSNFKTADERVEARSAWCMKRREESNV